MVDLSCKAKVDTRRANDLNPQYLGESASDAEIKALFEFLIAAFALSAIVIALVIVVINLWVLR